MSEQNDPQTASKPASLIERTLKFLTECGRIFNAFRMYNADHPSVKRGMEEAYAALKPLFEDTDAVAIGISDGSLVIDKEQVREMSPPVVRLVKLFSERKIESFVITKDLSLEELEAFVKLIASKDESLWDGGRLRTDVADRFKHLRLNEVRFKLLRSGSKSDSTRKG